MKQLALSEKDLTQFALIINELLDNLKWSMPSIWKDAGKAEPPGKYKIDGFICYANGVNFNPNNEGKGFYRWDAGGSQWVRIG